MGGKKTQTTTSNSNSNATSQTSPWEQTRPALDSILNQVTGMTKSLGLTGNENSALGGLEANAMQGNPYAPAIGNLANDLLAGGTDRTGMVQDNLKELRGGLLPYTTLDTNPYSNEAFTKFTDQLSGDALNKVKAQYAAMGYDPSTASFGKSVAEGTGRAVAPVWLQAQNDLEGRKLGAISGLYGAGNTTAGMLSNLDQTALGNRQAGVGTAASALQARDAPFQRMLEIEAQRQGLPMQRAAMAENLILPAAQSFGRTETDSESSQSNTTTQSGGNPFQQIFGGALTGLGLLAGGPAGGLLGGGLGGWGGFGAPMNLGNPGGTGLFGRGLY
jgi:hypothetical protein